MVFEVREREGKGRGEIARIAQQLGIHREALRTWIRQESRRIAELEREVRELAAGE
jgi:transposase